MIEREAFEDTVLFEEQGDTFVERVSPKGISDEELEAFVERILTPTFKPVLLWGEDWLLGDQFEEKA